MSTTLYRKYRPHEFGAVVGQEHVVTTLLNQIKQGNLAHAYIFTGPRGVGKTTTARLLAAAANEVSGEAAQRIFEGKDIDVIEIDAASSTSVDNVRENIIEQSRFAPHALKYKVFIIDEVHMLSNSAFNALLKLLEEPPKNTLFVLATTELHKVPATIVSRCQRFVFRKIPLQIIIEKLQGICAQEKREVESEVLNSIARLADGGLRDAESILGQVLSLAVENEKVTTQVAEIVLPASYQSRALTLLASVFIKDVQSALTKLHAHAQDGIDMNEYAKDCIELLRFAMLLKVDQNSEVIKDALTDSTKQELNSIINGVQLAHIVKALDVFAKRRLDIKHSISPLLPLELAVAELCAGTNEQISKVVNAQVSKPEIQIQKPEVKEERRMEKEESVVNQEIKKSINQEINTQPTIDCTLTLDQIKSGWNALLTTVQQTNPSIVMMLKTAEPQSLKDGELMIGYKYSFNKDRMSSPTAYDVLRDSFQKVFNQAPKITGTVLPAGYVSAFIKQVSDNDDVEVVMDSNQKLTTPPINQSTPVSTNNQQPPNPQPTTQNNPDDLVSLLVKTFGGRVVG